MICGRRINPKLVISTCFVGLVLVGIGFFIDVKETYKSSEMGRKMSVWMSDIKGDNTITESTQLPLMYETKLPQTSIYEERKNNIKGICFNHSEGLNGDAKDNEVMLNLHIDRYHQLLYCQIQKVGSTFIRELLKKLVSLKGKGAFGVKPGTERLVTLKAKLTFTDIHSIIQNSYKFMFVREPYSRVLSGYIDKLFAANPVYWDSVGRHTVSLFRKGASKLSKDCGQDLTFPEFVKYIINSETTRKRTDRHFTPMYEHCRPCQISYDFIGKMETFKEDAENLIKIWNEKYGINIKYNEFEKESDAKIAQSHVLRIYGMQKSIVKCMSFHTALWRTWRDLQMRGIIPISVDMPFTEDQAKVLKPNEFFYEINKVLKGITDHAKVKQQRQEALREAYSMVPIDDMQKLQKIIEPDCKLFGYDCRPDKLFNISARQSTKLKYFNVL